MNLRVFSCLKASFSVLFHNFRCFSSRRMFFSADDVSDGAPTMGDGVSICMSALAHEDILLVERDEDERVNVLFNLRIILQKLTVQHNSWNGLGK